MLKNYYNLGDCLWIVVFWLGVLYGEFDVIFVIEVICNVKKLGGVLYYFGSF